MAPTLLRRPKVQNPRPPSGRESESVTVAHKESDHFSWLVLSDFTVLYSKCWSQNKICGNKTITGELSQKRGRICGQNHGTPYPLKTTEEKNDK